MKKASKKLINAIYISFFIIIISIGGILVSFNNKSEWNNRTEAVRRCSDFAVSSFYSYTEMQGGELTEKNLEIIGKQILKKLDDTVASVQISRQFPESDFTVIPDKDKSYSYFESNDNNLTYTNVCLVTYSGQVFFITTRSDFTQLSKNELKSWYIFAGAAALLIILSGILLIVFNMLWQESDKNKKFMEGFTHELKTPMTSIMGYSDLIKNYELTEQEREKAVDALSLEATRLNNLSAQMLDIFVVQNDETSVSEVLTEQIADEIKIPLDTLAAKYEIAYELHFENESILCNKELIITLITNLADNAFKATVNADRKSKVVIEGKAEGPKFHFEIKDNGIGISKEHIKKITEPFYREDKTRSRKQGGAGLGLALCNEIAKKHGTELLFTSEKDLGTTVSFDLERSKG